MNKQKLPKGWKEVKFLESLGKEASSNKFKIQSKNFLKKGKYPIIDQGVGFIAGYTDDKSKVYSRDLPVVLFGDHTRILKFVDFPFALGADGVKILVPIKEINPRYYYFYLKSLNILSEGYSRHYKFLKEKRIAYPSPEIQKKIFSILKKAEKAKEWRKKADELTEDLINSIFSEMFLQGNKFKKEDLGNKSLYEEFFAGGDVPKDRLSYEKTDRYNVPIFTNGEKNKGFYGYTDKARVTKDSITISARGTIGYSEIRNGFFFPAIRLIVITPKEEVLNLHYLKYAIDNIKFNLDATSIPQLTVPDCKRFKIPLPPITLQNKFASIVKEVESMKEQQKHSKNEIDNLFNALMQKAFRGELIK